MSGYQYLTSPLLNIGNHDLKKMILKRSKIAHDHDLKNHDLKKMILKRWKIARENGDNK